MARSASAVLSIGMLHSNQRPRRGFILVAMSVSMLLLMAVMGLAFDLGRIYIARNEAQVFTDAAAMAAAANLDGTPVGGGSGEHTAELQSRFGISHAGLCLKKNNLPVRDPIGATRLRVLTAPLSHSEH